MPEVPTVMPLLTAQTKEVRKNDGTMAQYLVENSHEPIIEPEVFDMVQEKLKRHCANRSKIRSSHPFANRIICGDCGAFYGHKVWHNRNNTERYDVWYCNHKYGNGKRCQSPVINEEQIKEAFEMILVGHDTTGNSSFTEKLWRELVDTVMVYPGFHFIFHLNDGSEVEVILAK